MERVDIDVAQIERHLDTMCPGLPHTEDAAEAYIHAEGLGIPEGLHLVVIGVRLDDLIVVAARGLEVVVHRLHARGLKACEVVLAHEPETGAGLHTRVLSDPRERILQRTEVRFRVDLAARHDNRELLNATSNAASASATMVSAALVVNVGASVEKCADWEQKLHFGQRPDLAFVMPQVLTWLPLWWKRTASAASSIAMSSSVSRLVMARASSSLTPIPDFPRITSIVQFHGTSSWGW